jgi:hypothetical protein
MDEMVDNGYFQKFINSVLLIKSVENTSLEKKLVN